MRDKSGHQPVDVHVGERIKGRRLILGVSQQKLGDALGITFQQVQKYERGTNRVSASRLFSIAKALDVPVNYFFEDAETATATLLQPGEPEPMKNPRNVRLVRMFLSLSRPQQDRVFDLMRDITRSPDEVEVARVRQV